MRGGGGRGGRVRGNPRLGFTLGRVVALSFILFPPRPGCGFLLFAL